MTAFAYGTTYFSAVIFIGYAGQFGRTFGLASVWIVITFFVSLVTNKLEDKILYESFEKPIQDEIK